VLPSAQASGSPGVVAVRDQERDGHDESGKAYAGIDGEALELETPMTFRSHPLGLRMLVPEGNIEIALRRQSRGVHVRDPVQLAKGAPLG